MADELAAANVNRSYQLAASSIAIFTFLLFFLYPKFAIGQVDAIWFQAALIVMGVATFPFAFPSFFYQGASLGGRIDDVGRARYARRGDRSWLLRSRRPGSRCGSCTWSSWRASSPRADRERALSPGLLLLPRSWVDASGQPGRIRMAPRCATVRLRCAGSPAQRCGHGRIEDAWMRIKRRARCWSW